MILRVEGIHTFYELSHILFDISLYIHAGETVVLLGRNGVGKTTTLKTIMGLIRPRTGRVTYRGEDITHLPSYQISRLGIGFVPEDRRILADLTVWENLDVGSKNPAKGERRWSAERVYALFPILNDRRDQLGGTLSGGEQQMLAIARTLMGNPDLILLDEPSEGLAPLIVKDLGIQIQNLKNEGTVLLICEQNLHFSLRLSDRAYILEKGTIKYEGRSADLEKDQETKERYLGVAG
jgi:branched-chain amino acid transport system ATP-binding protein